MDDGSNLAENASPNDSTTAVDSEDNPNKLDDTNIEEKQSSSKKLSSIVSKSTRRTINSNLAPSSRIVLAAIQRANESTRNVPVMDYSPSTQVATSNTTETMGTKNENRNVEIGERRHIKRGKEFSRRAGDGKMVTITLNDELTKDLKKKKTYI